MWDNDHWILREMTWSMGAMLGSTVDLGSATVLGFWTNFTQFLRCRGLEFCSFLSPFSRRMEKCAQQMLQSSVPLAMRTLGNLDIISIFTQAGS